ncbi:hypothetical protein C8R42DRAFT_639155 [Lentinula raphanica]|nr:hypothetical protein C8R42DRAFT_639155 [Lentinula raphanica]
MLLLSRTNKFLGRTAFLALLFFAITVAIPITGPDALNPNGLTSSSSSAASQELVDPDIISRSALHARTELSDVRNPVLLPRDPKPGVMMSLLSTQQQVGTLRASVGCRCDTEDIARAGRVLEKMMNSATILHHLQDSLPLKNLGKVKVDHLALDYDIEGDLDRAKTYCLIKFFSDPHEGWDSYTLELWATLLLVEELPPHTYEPWTGIFWTYVPRVQGRRLEKVIWAEFKNGIEILQKKEENFTEDLTLGEEGHDSKQQSQPSRKSV